MTASEEVWKESREHQSIHPCSEALIKQSSEKPGRHVSLSMSSSFSLLSIILHPSLPPQSIHPSVHPLMDRKIHHRMQTIVAFLSVECRGFVMMAQLNHRSTCMHACMGFETNCFFRSRSSVCVVRFRNPSSEREREKRSWTGRVTPEIS